MHIASSNRGKMSWILVSLWFPFRPSPKESCFGPPPTLSPPLARPPLEAGAPTGGRPRRRLRRPRPGVWPGATGLRWPRLSRPMSNSRSCSDASIGLGSIGPRIGDVFWAPRFLAEGRAIISAALGGTYPEGHNRNFGSVGPSPFLREKPVLWDVKRRIFPKRAMLFEVVTCTPSGQQPLHFPRSSKKMEPSLPFRGSARRRRSPKRESSSVSFYSKGKPATSTYTTVHDIRLHHITENVSRYTLSCALRHIAYFTYIPYIPYIRYIHCTHYIFTAITCTTCIAHITYITYMHGLH